MAEPMRYAIPTQVCATYTWATGEALQVVLTLQTDYPDALAEGAATVRRMMREQVADLYAVGAAWTEQASEEP
ncbi:MAG TPA: hypothetical protein VN088_14775 [Nocardioides sp.]|nr:hypothetical protein [Nocardioides sp.]